MKEVNTVLMQRGSMGWTLACAFAAAFVRLARLLNEILGKS
jgi:hypothetical protein